MNRREFTRLALAGLGMQALPLIAGENTGYTKANTDWLAKCRYGIGVHWTAQTVPRYGDLWRDSPDKVHSHLIKKMSPQKIATVIEELMLQLPSAKR